MTITQVDRLGERLRAGSTASADFIALADYRNGFLPFTGLVAEVVAEIVRPLEATVTQRPAKSTPSIVAKLRRERSRLSKMRDIGGLRVVVGGVLEQDRIVDRIAARFHDHQIVDRRSSPRYGYRAVHVIVREGTRNVEIQVRTQLQNRWAQASESLADRFGQEVKYGGRPDVTQPLLDVSEIVALLEVSDKQLGEMKRSAVLALWRSRPNRRLSPVDRFTYDRYVELRRRNQVLKTHLEETLARLVDEA